MKKIKLSFILCITLIILSGCNTVRKGFENPKKDNSDEFLVEKKSPLVMPPEFNELPIPNQKNGIEKTKDNKIKNLITQNSESIDQELSDTNIEDSILSKIKNN